MALPENFVSRTDLEWGTSSASRATLGSGLVIHYDSSNKRLANKDHSECIAYWQWCRRFHTGPSRGWVDVGYSFMSCPHDYILEGRGINRQQAAQPGGNATHYSVTLATGPDEDIPAAQINSVRRLRKWLMDDYGNSGVVLGHRDFIATSCPGDRAYTLVQDGTFAQPPGAIITNGDTMTFLGLRKGDRGQLVRDFQKFLDDCGYPSADSFADGEWDGVFGSGVEAALVALRRDNGSDATSSPHVSYWAMNQLRRAHWRAMYRRYHSPASGDGNVSLPANVRFVGRLEGE